jgi:hypothetical protein
VLILTPRRVDASDTLLVAVSPSVPWKDRHYEWTYEIMSESADWETLSSRPPTIGSIMPWIEAKIQEHHDVDALLIVERAQVEYADLFDLAPAGWLTELEAALTGSRAVHVVFRNEDATVYRIGGVA